MAEVGGRAGDDNGEEYVKNALSIRWSSIVRRAKLRLWGRGVWYYCQLIALIAVIKLCIYDGWPVFLPGCTNERTFRLF